jgi:hypothetical protein
MDTNELTDEEKIERDIEALALLIFDIYMDKKQRKLLGGGMKVE